MAVKGSIHHSMRVIPHRPFIQWLRYLGLSVVFVIAVIASYYAGIYQVEQQQHTSSSDITRQYQQSLNEVTQELTKLLTNVEVDRQTIEELRQLTMTQKAQMMAYERDLRVYKDLLSPGAKANPLGISFGVFTVFAASQKHLFKYKLVVQKLSDKEGDFTGNLDFRVAGEQAGKSVSLPLYQLSDQMTSPLIALNFKYFQTLEGEFRLPADFTPRHVELAVKSSDKKSAPIVQTELEWPASLH